MFISPSAFAIRSYITGRQSWWGTLIR